MNGHERCYLSLDAAGFKRKWVWCDWCDKHGNHRTSDCPRWAEREKQMKENTDWLKRIISEGVEWS